MRLVLSIILSAVLGSALLTSQVSAEETPVLKTAKDKENYVIGVNLVRDCKKQGIDLDLDIFGLPEALLGGCLKSGLNGTDDLALIDAFLSPDLVDD